MKMWSGRFQEEESELLERFNGSINFDKRMYKEDIKGSIAHCIMLEKCRIISSDDRDKIVEGLKKVEKLIENGEFIFSIKDEDIHMAIEKKLTEIVGEVGGKLHTSRSRNDQVALTTKLYLKKECIEIKKLLKKVMTTIHERSVENIETILPGYTHMQRAQPISLAHHLMAYFQMFRRDYDKLSLLFDSLDEMPLGSLALAGTTYPIDREFVKEYLGFSRVSENSMDSVSNKDFIIEFNFVLSLIGMHLSRFSEELILWSTTEFNFIKISDRYSTGSSIMPQKKNPDIAELIRGKTGRLYGNLFSILTVMKGLPLSYNKDTQEDKEGVFDSIDTIKGSLEIFDAMLSEIEFLKEGMEKDLDSGFLNATDLADYLAKKNIPFRQAHHIVGSVVLYCEKEGKNLVDLSLEELQTFSPIFSNDIYKSIDIRNCVDTRNSYGGTGKNALKVQLNNGKEFLSSL